MRRLGDGETRRWGDAGRGDGETRGRGDGEPRCAVMGDAMRRFSGVVASS